MLVICLYAIFKLYQVKTALKLEREKLRQYTKYIQQISEKNLSTENLQHFEFYDVLTDLPNRLLFENRFAHLLVKAERDNQNLPLLFINLDRFKAVNESSGHKMGDLLLKQVAGRLVGCVRESDTVAHMGSDEFTIIFEADNQPDDVIRFASRIAQSILNEISRPFELDKIETFVSACIGIVVYPVDGEDVDELMKNVDTAMQFAKEQGHNRYSFYEPKMNAAAKKRGAMESEMRTAIENGEFCLFYQPLLDLKSNQFKGAEALLRWHHPVRGSIPRQDFIPLAEETGLIVPLGEWVIAEAMTQVRTWYDRGLSDFRVSINVSLHQARQNELIAFVQRMLEEIDIPPEFIALELTESVFMANMERINHLLSQLAELGIALIIDDFGTGYSSLARLKHLPATTVKIDQSFVKDLTMSVDNANLIKAIIAMAHSLHMKVVAEGIETSGQLEYLKNQNCDIGQGYKIGRPVSAADFDKSMVEFGIVNAEL